MRKRPLRLSRRGNILTRSKIGKTLASGALDLSRGLLKLGGLVFLAVTVSDKALRAAGGDLVEAMGNHKCGPDCWHAIGKTRAERARWWADKLKAYEERMAEHREKQERTLPPSGFPVVDALVRALRDKTAPPE